MEREDRGTGRGARHALLCVVVGEGSGPGAAALADAWAAGAPRCTVETVALGAGNPHVPGRGAGASGPAPRPSGVFVPLTDLGLSTTREVVAPDVALLRERVPGADVVVVHVTELDAQALAGGPVADVAGAATAHAVPVVVLADRVLVTRRQWSAAGVSGVYELGPAGGHDDAGRQAAVARVARTWAPSWAAPEG
ncbi:glycerate kinase [Isoptericola sp. NEAU-Y5]|uniref:Glycerate kinase n=1 Tax=Isoptericola luteus TaxID=2879484 RepID=A0ABS7ZJR7_9MICO|nr:glycerate kinase [Isoptericola sp. NEAU-Y5]MCA5895256.1 glycerate kinase [Isoptericola sp. NEAU-Y5]